MLKINDLHASVEDKTILKGINLEIKPGEVHAIMGPNGSGKSTLASVIAGKEEYAVNTGEILMNGENIDELSDLLDEDPSAIKKAMEIFEQHVSIFTKDNNR